MRKMYSLLAMMVLALGIPAVAQESIQDYVEGFDNLDTSNHEFAPKGWGHIVDSYSSGWSSSYVEYSNPQTGGQDGRAYLSIGSQEVNAGWTTASLNDILVTPAVSGNVSIYVKLEKASGSIKFFTCTKNGNEFTASEEEYAVEIPELSEEAWTQVSIPDVPAGTYLGIRGEDVGIDNFAAENATIVYKRELTIESAELVTETIAGGGIDAGEDGNASFTYRVTLTNTGEVDLNPGYEGYSISIVHSDAPEIPLSTKELDFPLAVGATSQPVDISVTIPVEEEIYDRWDVKENISGTTEYVTWLTLYPYKSDFFVSEGDHADIFKPGTELQFGLSQQPVTKTFRLRNNGGAEATVTAVTAPEGFTCKVRNAENVEQQLPLVVPAHSGTDFYLDVTMTADAPGAKSGDLVIKVEGYEDLEFPLSGQIVDPSKFYVNFEDGQFPAGTYLEGSSWKISNFPGQQDIEGNEYCAENGTAMAANAEKMVFPKVRVAEGETMVFSAAKRSMGSFVTVYYSADRSEWTPVRTISDDSENEADHFSNETTGISTYDNYVFRQYTIDNIPAGDWYIAFESGYARVDDIMGYTLLDVPEVDFVVTDFELPEAATVNHDYSASISLYNVGTAAVAENQLTAKLYVGDNAVAEQTLPAMETGGEASIDFSYTPREAGDFTARIAVENNGEAVVERSVDLSIAEETPSADYSLGTAGNTSSNVPLALNWNNSDSETIYTKDLIGFPAGAKILQLTYRGYKTAETHKAHIRVWIENTTDGIFEGAPDDLHSTDGMTQIYDGEYTFEQKGSSNDIQDMLVIPLAEPFEYTGENLRVIVRAEKIDQYKSVAFECDRNVQNASAYRRDDDKIPEGSLTLSSELPVVHMLVEKDLTVLSGKVVSSKDQSVIAGAAIKLVSGNVEYSGTSSDDGSYSIGVYQDMLEYTLTAEKDGYFDYEKTVSFPEGSTEMDIAMDEATGFRLVEANIPATAMVNYAYTATVTIENGLEKPAGSYTAELYVGGEVVATDNEAALEANSDHTFTFSYTPHAAGTFPAYVKLTSDYGTSQTDEVQLVIAEESAESMVQVGEPSDMYYTGVVNTFYQASRTEIIYPQEMIGLEKDSKIVSLQFKGYHGAKDNAQFEVRVWMGNTQSAEFAGSDVTGLQLVYDGTFDLSQSAGSAENPATLIDIQIPDGFVYDGGNIRVVAESFEPEGDYLQTYFELDESVKGYARQITADGATLDNIEEESYSGWGDIPMPVVYFGLIPSRSVSGVVTDSETGVPVEGAAVTLRSGEVEYYAVTDVDGSYSVDVIQYSLDYEMTVEAEGYKPAVEAVSFADGDVADKDVALVKDDGSGVDSIGIEGFKAYGGSGCIVVETEADAQVYVYNTVGSLVRSVEAVAGKTRIDGIGAGLYIVNGVKVIVR